MLGSVLEYPLPNRVVLFDLGRVLGFGRAVVDGKYSGSVGAYREFAKQSIVCLVVSENPSGAVDVEHHRQWSGSAFRSNDASADRSPLACIDVHPLFVDVGSCDAVATL